MSCFIVGTNHVRYLVAAAEQWKALDYYHPRLRSRQTVTPEYIGRALMLCNVEAFTRAYDGRHTEAAEWKEAHEWKPIHPASYDHIDPVQVLKSISCYEYQASDHAQWDDHDCAFFLARLKEAAIHRLPGFEAAKYGAPEPTKAARKVAPGLIVIT